MASSKDALRRQRRRELDARRSKSRVRLGACLPRWGRLKDSLGFTLHSELAQFLLESYLSKVDSKSSYVGERESAIMASVEALDRLVQLVHCHGQGCPHLPTLLQQSAAGKPRSDPCPGQRQRPERRPELDTWASSDPENRPSSTGAGLPGSPETPDGELCLSYVCESGHTLSWSPETQGGLESEGGGKGVPLTTDPPRKQGQRQGSKAVREGTSVELGGTVMRTRSRSGVQRMETRRLTAQRAAGGAGEKEQEEEEEEEEEEVRSSMSTGTDGTQEDSGQVETDTGNVAVPTGFPQTTQPCTDIATLPRVTKTNPDKRSSDISKNTARPSRRSNRTSVSNDEAPLIVNKRKRKANPKEILLCTYEGCEKIFSSRQYLNHHMKYQHIQQKTFSCSHASCGKAFNFKKHLKEHEKLHSNQRDYICEFCARAFRTNSNLIIHRRIHTGEKPLQCEVCGFTCCQKASLNWHMKKHNAESSYQFPCDICGRRFEKRDNVTAHRSKSHPEHPTPASSGPPDPVTSSDLSTAPSVSVLEDPKQ